MSLNSVVNNLVRAAAGIPADISDTDLDAHVARLLSDEAKARESKWSELGLVGLLRDEGRDSPDPSLPKTNKRFLASVIRTVDGHNSALLRAQAQAARDARDDRRGESSRSARAEPGSRSAGASRLFDGALKGMRESDSANRRSERDSRNTGERRGEDERRPRRGDQNESGRYHVRDARDRHSYSRGEGDGGRSGDRYDSDEDRRRMRRYREDEGDDRDRRRSRRRESEEELVRHSSRRHHGERDLDRGTRDGESSPRRAKESRGDPPTSHVDSPARQPPRRRSPTPPSSPSTARSPSPPADKISKMDRYFETSYDPRLDLPAVPSQGLVQEVGWDNMLAILKERGKKRRHQSPTLSDSAPAPPPGVLPSKRSYSPDTSARKAERQERKARKALKAEKEERRKRRGDDSSDDERERRRRKEKKRREKERDKDGDKEKEGGVGSSSLLDGYAYVKKGGTREWDMGK